MSEITGSHTEHTQTLTLRYTEHYTDGPTRTHVNTCRPPRRPRTAQMRTGTQMQPLSSGTASSLTRASVPTSTPATRPAPVTPDGRPDTHHTDAPACPAACPQLHAGISASEKSPIQAAAPRHCPLSPLSSQLRGSGPSPLPAPCGQR